MEHPSREQLQRFVDGFSTREENRQIVRHLLRECALCQEVIQAAWRPPIPPPDAFDNALRALEEAAARKVRRLPTFLTVGI